MPSLFEPLTAQSIRQRVENLQPNAQRLWGVMTASQMLKHVNQALGTATGDVVTKSSFMMKLFAPMIKKLVLKNEPYKPSLPTAKEFIIKDDTINFDTEKQALLNRFDKFITAGESAVDGKKHPAFGKLSAFEWGFSQWKHFDHHLKQFGV